MAYLVNAGFEDELLFSEGGWMWPAVLTDRCSVEDRKEEPARLQCRNETASANGGVDPKIVPQSQHPKQDL